MELRQLQTFLTLSELKNFTKTAAKLGYSQSNITAQIKQLEQELGKPLFNRLGHSVTLTEDGYTLIPYATKILSLSQEAVETLVVKSHTIISIIASESLCTYRLPQLLNAFRQSHPEVEFHIQLLDTNDYYTPLASGQADIAYVLQNQLPILMSKTYLPVMSALVLFAHLITLFYKRISLLPQTLTKFLLY